MTVERQSDRQVAVVPAIVQAVVGHVRIVVIGRKPTDAEFVAHIAEAVTLAATVRGVLVLGDDEAAAPSARARQELVKAGLGQTPTAVISNLSLIARSIMTAMRWLGARVRGFTPDRFDEACDFLHAPPALRPTIRAEIARLQEMVRWAPGQ